LVLLNCSILYVPNSGGVHERSGHSEPSTSTCHHLSLAAASNTCIAMGCARSHNTAHSYRVAITYVSCFKYYVQKCTVCILSSFPASRASYATANHVWLQLLCVARTPPFILHKWQTCLYIFHWRFVQRERNNCGCKMQTVVPTRERS